MQADETRKTSVRSASAAVGTSAHLNSLQSSQDSGGKLQQTTQQVQSGTGQTTYTRVQTPEFTSITQPHNVYTQPTAPTGGYFISVNPQNVPSAALGAGKLLGELLRRPRRFRTFNRLKEKKNPANLKEIQLNYKN